MPCQRANRHEPTAVGFGSTFKRMIGLGIEPLWVWLTPQKTKRVGHNMLGGWANPSKDQTTLAQYPSRIG